MKWTEEHPYRSNALTIISPVKTWRVFPVRFAEDECPLCKERSSPYTNGKRCQGKKRFIFFGRYMCPNSILHKHWYCRFCENRWLEQVPSKPVYPEPEGTISAQ